MRNHADAPGGKRLIIVCAGGQGAIVADILLRARESGSEALAVGFVDDTPSLQQSEILGLPVLGPVAALSRIPHDGVVIAVGDNRHRRRLAEQLTSAGERLCTAIHPRATVSPHAVIGDGSVICAGAIVAPRAQLGIGVIVNTNASIDHDSRAGDFAHVSAGATVGARVTVGTETLIAIGASVVSGRQVGARCVIGAGAVVVRDIPDDVEAWGVPARVTRARRV